jgi:hypothetical protein
MLCSWANSHSPQQSTNLNGWNASLAGNYNQWFGLTGDFSEAYHSEGGADFRSYTYTLGPTIASRKVYSVCARSVWRGSSNRYWWLVRRFGERLCGDLRRRSGRNALAARRGACGTVRLRVIPRRRRVGQRFPLFRRNCFSSIARELEIVRVATSHSQFVCFGSGGAARNPGYSPITFTMTRLSRWPSNSA